MDVYYLISDFYYFVCFFFFFRKANTFLYIFRKASTIIGELKCLTMEQGSALAVRAMAAYGDSPENYNTNRSILASIGVIAGDKKVLQN